MYLINRQVAIVKPKQPFVDWVDSISEDPSENVSLKEVRSECTVYLVADGANNEEEALEYLYEFYDEIFADQLDGWYTDETRWPQDISLVKFKQWFDIEVHSMVVDLYEDEIEKEPY